LSLGIPSLLNLTCISLTLLLALPPEGFSVEDFSGYGGVGVDQTASSECLPSGLLGIAYILRRKIATHSQTLHGLLL
jgi:hypothetical protein